MSDPSGATPAGFKPGQYGFGVPAPSKQDVAFFHRGADTDQGDGAIHHTLGERHGQSAPGTSLQPLRDADAALQNALDDVVADVTAVQSLLSYPYRRNLARNGNLAINQRGFVSGSSLADNAYFLDGWKNVSGTTTNLFTFTGGSYGRTLVIGNSGNSRTMRQTLERVEVPTGSYVLSWSGTALGRVYKAGGSAPALAASPIVFTSDGLDDVRLEIGGAGVTVTNIQFERGTVPTPFEIAPYALELLRCQRYYYRTTAATATRARLGMAGFQNTTTQAEAFFVLPIAMRTTPAVNVNSCYWTDGVNFSASITSISLPASVTYNVGPMLMTYVHWSGASGAALRPGTVSANGTGAYVEFSAEF